MESNENMKQGPPPLVLSTEGAEVQYETLSGQSKPLGELADLATNVLRQVSSIAAASPLLGLTKESALQNQLAPAFSIEKIEMAASLGVLALDNSGPIEALSDLNEAICGPSKEIQKSLAAFTEPFSLLRTRLADTLAASYESFALPQVELAAFRGTFAMPHAVPLMGVKTRTRPRVSTESEPLIALDDEAYPQWSTDDVGQTEVWTPRPTADQWLRRYDISIQHVELRRVTRRPFADGYYAYALEQAAKLLEFMVRVKSGLTHKFGAPLMRQALSVEKPILLLNDFRSQSNKDEQRGYSDICAGFMTGIKNPRSHDPYLEDSPEVTLQRLATAQDLICMIDKAKRTSQD